jgi:HAD superfamily hydrolase (TIGR01509 family)
MTLRVITFDLDNTLWDVEPALLRAEAAQRRWLLEHRPGAVDDLDEEQLWDLKKQLWKANPELAHDVSAMRRLFLERLQLAAGYDATRAREGAVAAFDAFLVERQRVELYPGALEVIAELAERFCLGALTNGNADIYRTEAGPYFEFAFQAEQVGASKPAAAMFEAALARTGRKPVEVLHVGDSVEHDVLGAQRGGLRTVWVNAKAESWTEATPPDATIRHVTELADALRGLNQV